METAKTNACFMFTDEENGKQIGEIIVPLESADFTKLKDSGYLYLLVDQEPPLMVPTELFNAVQEGDYYMLETEHVPPVVTYTKWVKSLRNTDLEEEYQARQLDYYSDGQNEEYEGQYREQYQAVDAVREARINEGRDWEFD